MINRLGCLPMGKKKRKINIIYTCSDYCRHHKLLDWNGDGIPDCAQGMIPTVSEWGLAAMGLLLLAFGKVYFNGRRQTA